MAYLFVGSIFLSSFLLMLVQPMMAKALLPATGGAPAMWITCMLFFQCLLLGGYAYAAISSARLRPLPQMRLHLVLLVIAMAGFLPLQLTLPDAFNATQSPELLVLTSLLISTGFPYFVLTANSSLIQRWFHARYQQSPWYLFSVSNLGSIGGVIAYPFLVEWLLPLSGQMVGWSAGFALLCALLSIIMLRSRTDMQEAASAEEGLGKNLPARSILRVVLLGFIPSSLFLSVTLYITTDIASFPLIWMLPFAIYLLSFVIAFSSHGCLLVSLSQKLHLVAIGSLLIMTVMFGETWYMLIHYAGLAVLCISCHGRVAQERPDAQYLTAFYFWLSLGGALGGLFNTIAPYLFNSLAEYPLVLLLALAALPLQQYRFELFRRITARQVIVTLSIISAGFIAFGLLRTPPQQPSAATVTASAAHEEKLFQIRNFYGVLKVGRNETSTRFYHGTTLHGIQPVAAADRLALTTYYVLPGTVIAQMPESFFTRPFALIGLGAGTLACAGVAGQTLDVFEINPDVTDIAQNPDYFTYLSDCPPQIAVHPGDGRLEIARQPDHHYNLIVVDAFTSDAIPLHLLTKEAFALYLQKLDPQSGILALHITNRHFDLRDVIAKLAEESGYQAVLYDRSDAPDNPYDTTTRWVFLMPPGHEALPAEVGHTQIHTLSAPDNTPLWTDDYSFVLPYLDLF